MDNFDLKKFLKESKALENLNPSFKALNENKSLRNKIREIIITELNGDEDYELEDRKIKYGINPEIEPYDKDIEDDEEEWVYDPGPYDDDDDLEDWFNQREHYRALKKWANYKQDESKLTEEAKKKKDEEVEDVEDTEVTDTTEETPADEEVPAEETPAAGGNLEDVAADMEGTEGDLMDALMKAFKIAKGMNNEKLETQVGNTLKFFVSEYIGGGED